MPKENQKIKVAKNLNDIFKIADELRKTDQTEVDFILEMNRIKVRNRLRLEPGGGWSYQMIEDLTPKWKIGDIK